MSLYNVRIFISVKNDFIQLRTPSLNVSFISDVPRKSKNRRTKYDVYKKECFFYFHHPQSCPLSISDCTYSHEKLSACDDSTQ